MPSVRVSLVTSVRLLPHQAAVVPVHMVNECPLTGPLLLELDPDAALQLGDMLLQFSEDGMAQVVVSNPTGCSCFAEEGITVGEVTDISIVVSDDVPELSPTEESEMPRAPSQLSDVSERLGRPEQAEVARDGRKPRGTER